jgi:hypothetical protein
MGVTEYPTIEFSVHKFIHTTKAFESWQLNKFFLFRYRIWSCDCENPCLCLIRAMLEWKLETVGMI